MRIGSSLFSMTTRVSNLSNAPVWSWISLDLGARTVVPSSSRGRPTAPVSVGLFAKMASLQTSSVPTKALISVVMRLKTVPIFIFGLFI